MEKKEGADGAQGQGPGINELPMGKEGADGPGMNELSMEKEEPNGAQGTGLNEENEEPDGAQGPGLNELSGIIQLWEVTSDSPSGDIPPAPVIGRSMSCDAQGTSSTVPIPFKPSRSWPSGRIQCDSIYDVKMHAVGLAYIQMKDDGYLELVNGEHSPGDSAAFEVEEVQAPSKGIGKVFRLKNVKYQQYYLTGHIDTMKVDGHKIEDDDRWSQWTATTVPESADVQHCFKLQIHAPHYAKNWYFYVREDKEFMIGVPRGVDKFQIENSK